MSIEMVGGVYCPLSPRDPDQRLHALVTQTEARMILVHWLTHEKFTKSDGLLDIDTIINNRNIVTVEDLEKLSTIGVTSNSIAYVIFTSGSTGAPKAVCLRVFFR